jgi:hypothetical protein
VSLLSPPANLDTPRIVRVLSALLWRPIESDGVCTATGSMLTSGHLVKIAHLDCTLKN